MRMVSSPDTARMLGFGEWTGVASLFDKAEKLEQITVCNSLLSFSSVVAVASRGRMAIYYCGMGQFVNIFVEEVSPPRCDLIGDGLFITQSLLCLHLFNQLQVPAMSTPWHRPVMGHRCDTPEPAFISFSWEEL